MLTTTKKSTKPFKKTLWHWCAIIVFCKILFYSRDTHPSETTSVCWCGHPQQLLDCQFLEGHCFPLTIAHLQLRLQPIKARCWCSQRTKLPCLHPPSSPVCETVGGLQCAVDWRVPGATKQNLYEQRTHKIRFFCQKSKFRGFYVLGFRVRVDFMVNFRVWVSFRVCLLPHSLAWCAYESEIVEKCTVT